MTNPAAYKLAEAFLRESELNVDRVTVERHAKVLAARIEGAMEDYLKEPDDVDMSDLDDPHERAAAQARDNDFEETGGKDWT